MSVPVALQKKIDAYKKINWPWQLLLADEEGAQAMHDNGYFFNMTAFGHGFRFENGQVEIFTKFASEKVASWKPWSKIRPFLKLVQAMTWKIISNFTYTEEGFIEQDCWAWKVLKPCYHFPKDIGYSFVDIITSCWEFEGWPGFGFGIGQHHGHANIEFCDGKSFYSLGQYPHPEYEVMGKMFSTQHGILINPDPYVASRGEKVVHRFHIGSGDVGKANIDVIIKRLEAFQKVGLIHNPTVQNCTDFAIDFELFVKDLPESKLIDFEKTSPVFPGRKLVNKDVVSYQDIFIIYLVCLLVNLLITVLFITPFVSSKLGRGTGVVVKDKKNEHEIAAIDYGISWRSPTWTRNLRMKQMLDSEISKHSARFMIE